MKLLLFFGLAFTMFHSGHSTIPDWCQLPRDEGEGNSYSFAVYYDPNKDSCEPFLYKGQGGNVNRFPNERDCIRNCSVNAENIYPIDQTKACSFHKAPGKCSVQIVRFYYDSVHDKCKSFLWTGCFGNGNRFPDQKSCNATCAGIHDDRDEVEEEEPDTPFAIICGVLIGVIAAIVLIIAITLTVTSKKKATKDTKKTKEAPVELPLQEVSTEVA